jgi:lipopolysaccharide transport system ATP-binding protein
MSEVMLEMQNVSKKFRRGQLHDSLRDLIPALTKSLFTRPTRDELGRQEFWALNDVSFAIQRGEALGIIGPNGSGKSTILKILTGIMNPTKGVKTVNGTLSALIEVGAGFHPDLTGRENIFLNGTILGMTRREIRAKLDDIIEFSGLREFVDTPVKRYSSGMYARLGFSIACHVDPDVLVVDEVLSVGDWAFQNRSMEKMQAIVNGGATVIFVSHNLKAVTSLCDRALFLEKGRVQALGPAHEVADRYIRRVAQQAETDVDRDKDAYIESVRLIGESGDLSLVQPGQPAAVEIRVRAPRCDKPLAVAVALRDEDYSMFFYVDSARLLHEPLTLGPEDAVTFRFDMDMHLAPGSYFLNAALTRPDIDQLLDHKAPALSFVVHSDVDIRGVANLYPRLTLTEAPSETTSSTGGPVVR